MWSVWRSRSLEEVGDLPAMLSTTITSSKVGGMRQTHTMVIVPQVVGEFEECVSASFAGLHTPPSPWPGRERPCPL